MQTQADRALCIPPPSPPPPAFLFPTHQVKKFLYDVVRPGLYHAVTVDL
jgi:hypothetical protein